jgi:hypothetical protein
MKILKQWNLLVIFCVAVGFISCDFEGEEGEEKEVRYFWNRSRFDVTIKPISGYSEPFDQFTMLPDESVRLEVNNAYLEGNNGKFKYTYSPSNKVTPKSSDEKFGTWFEFIDQWLEIID